jgi:hypothetical protein
VKPEQAIQKSILEYLAVKKIWHMRVNTGAIVSEYKGRSRMIRYGIPGCADILCSLPSFLWLEVKAPKGVQSEQQKQFQKEVEEQGHLYYVVRSIEDVEEILKGL